MKQACCSLWRGAIASTTMASRLAAARAARTSPMAARNRPATQFYSPQVQHPSFLGQSHRKPRLSVFEYTQRLPLQGTLKVSVDKLTNFHCDADVSVYSIFDTGKCAVPETLV